jgi:hypothetical protein
LADLMSGGSDFEGKDGVPGAPESTWASENLTLAGMGFERAAMTGTSPRKARNDGTSSLGDLLAHGALEHCAAERPTVRTGLPAGGRRIRTIGSWANSAEMWARRWQRRQRLAVDNDDCAVEAARAFVNLHRRPTARGSL